MNFSLLSMLIALLIPLLILALAHMISFNSSLYLEKGSPFECGFDPLSNARISFSLRFFLLAVIFLIFDIEIVLLTPTPFLFSFFFSGHTFMIFLMFILILFFGLIHEWKEGSLEWTN